jgi:hypothetical protein
VIASDVSHTTGVEVLLTPISSSALRLDMTTTAHPLDVEAWPLVDSVLVVLDRLLGGLVEINDCPRDWWRPFRSRADTSQNDAEG